MSGDYGAFLAGKVPTVAAVGREIDPATLPEGLSDHARAITTWAVRKGRAAIFAGTGLHKSRMQVAWLQEMAAGDRGLIFAPLAVAEQTIREAEALGIILRWAEDQPRQQGLYVTNYEKRHKFDPAGWRAVALDESSILKNVAGKTREALIRDWASKLYRLAAHAAHPDHRWQARGLETAPAGQGVYGAVSPFFTPQLEHVFNPAITIGGEYVG